MPVGEPQTTHCIWIRIFCVCVSSSLPSSTPPTPPQAGTPGGQGWSWDSQKLRMGAHSIWIPGFSRTWMLYRKPLLPWDNEDDTDHCTSAALLPFLQATKTWGQEGKGSYLGKTEDWERLQTLRIKEIKCKMHTYTNNIV